jgi:hypothetical protein
MKNLFKTIVSSIDAFTAHANLANENIRTISNNAVELTRETRKAIIEAAIETKASESLGRAEEALRHVVKGSICNAMQDIEAAAKGMTTEELKAEKLAEGLQEEKRAEQKRAARKHGAQA